MRAEPIYPDDYYDFDGDCLCGHLRNEHDFTWSFEPCTADCNCPEFVLNYGQEI